MDYRVIAVVVSWNLCDRVLRCVDNLAGAAAVERVIVVDNGSSDGTARVVKERFPSVEVIENEHNIGFAAAANKGIGRAIELGADFVLMVNSDVEAPATAVRRLVVAATEEEAAAVGAKLLRENDPSRLDGAWGIINWRNFISRVEGEGKPDGPTYSRRRKVDYPLGAFLLLRAEAIQKVGMFDESYFAYHEEMELCEKLRRAGFSVVYEPVGVLHGARESVRAAGAQLAREYLLARNSVRFVRSYGAFLQKVKFWSFVVAASSLKFPAALIRGALRAHIANIHGWWDGLLNRPFDRKLQVRYRLIHPSFDKVNRTEKV